MNSAYRGKTVLLIKRALGFWNGVGHRGGQTGLVLQGNPALRKELFIRFGDFERLVISQAFAKDLFATGRPRDFNAINF
jgi:hypothetical protein